MAAGAEDWAESRTASARKIPKQMRSERLII